MANKIERPTGKKQKMPKPAVTTSLGQVKNYGSATRDVLTTSNRIMGGQRDTVVRREDMSAHQTARPDNPERMPLPLGYTPADFKVSQVPNTGPKFSPDDDNRVRPETNKIIHRSRLMITHGKTATKKGI